MRAARAKEKKKNGTKIFIIVLIILIIIAGALLAVKIIKDKKDRETANVSENETNEIDKMAVIEEKKQPKTMAGTTRPIAFMIDNNINAMPQAGLEQADLVYELIVEGGETRLMMVMKDKKVSKIGPLRSSRHNFLDYALENDAIYVHYGWSPQAKSDISKLGVNNINGIFESSSSFWRDNSRYAPHNAVTSTEDVLKIAKRKDYRTTTKKDTVLNYVADEVELEDGQVADTVTIPYSDHNTVKYTYDAKKKVYTRYSRGKKQTDWNTEKTVTTKNIIISFAKNTSLDSKDRQNIDNIKTLDGYYITNGKAIKIKCEKTSRSSQTVYKDLEGNEINVNDGKTFIQICPLNAKVDIKANASEAQ